MFNSKKKEEIRLARSVPDTISEYSYNLIIGAMLLYGFIVNALLVAFAGDFVAKINPIALVVGYFIAVIVAAIMVHASKNPIVSFIGYNLIVVPIGALMSQFVPSYDPQNIVAAITVTAMVTVVMMFLGTTFKGFFSKIGVVLFAALIIGAIAELIAMLFGYGGDLFNWLFVIIFSVYIGYDWYKAQAYGKTVDNAIDSSVDLYMDIINVFIRLLSLFSRDD